MTDSLQFPIHYKACPWCGSEDRLAERLKQDLVKEGKMRPDAIPFMMCMRTQITDPAKVTITLLHILIYVDTCLKCGRNYTVRIDKETVIPKSPGIITGKH
jgi:hypothetical protein